MKPSGLYSLLFAFAVASTLSGCSSAKPKPDEAPAQDGAFKAEVTSQPFPTAVEADVATDVNAVAWAQSGAAASRNVKPAAPGAAKAPGKGAPAETDDEGPSVSEEDRALGMITYVVKREDTLMKISFSVFGDVNRWKQIYQGNRAKIKNPNALSKGTVLKISAKGYAVIEKNGQPYLIKRRDTLVKISDHLYGTFARWKDLWHNNRQLIHDPNKIYAGFHLYYLPDEAEHRSMGMLLRTGATSGDRETASVPTETAAPMAPVIANPPSAPESPASPPTP